MGKKKWDGKIPDLESQIRDIAFRNRMSFDLDGGGTERITESSDGTLHVDWYGPSNSSKGHWHFVFDIDENGKLKNGRFAHK